MNEVILHILYSVLAGGAAGVISWRRKYPKTSFNFWKMAPTLGVTMVAGAIIGFQGGVVDDVTLGPIITMLLSVGADGLIGNFLKWVKGYLSE